MGCAMPDHTLGCYLEYVGCIQLQILFSTYAYHDNCGIVMTITMMTFFFFLLSSNTKAMAMKDVSIRGILV